MPCPQNTPKQNAILKRLKEAVSKAAKNLPNLVQQAMIHRQTKPFV